MIQFIIFPVCVSFTGDGSCFFWSADLLSHASGDINSWELIGPDYDPVYSIGRSSNAVYTASRDAKIRKYILKRSEPPS